MKELELNSKPAEHRLYLTPYVGWNPKMCPEDNFLHLCWIKKNMDQDLKWLVWNFCKIFGETKKKLK